MKALIALALILAPASGLAAPARYAVIIGNNEGRAEELVLKYAEADARRLADVMRRLGDVSAHNTTLLLGEPAASIRQSLLEINARIRSEPGGALLFVYYSGHADADGLHPGAEPIPYAELRALMAGSPAAVRVLVLDGCRSGGLTKVKGGVPAPEFEIKASDDAGVEGLAMISSSAAGEDSHESERLSGSFFSHHFVAALQGAADSNGDEKITLNEAYKYAYHQTVRSSGRTTSLQHPTFAYDLKGRAELVVTALRSGGKPSGFLALDEPGIYLIAKAQEGGEVIAEISAAKNTHLALPPDEYFVQRRAPEYYQEYHVVLAAGAKVELRTQPSKDVAYARLVRKGAPEQRSIHGLFVLAAARGPMLEGEGPSAGVIAGWGVDFEWASLALRAGVGSTWSASLESDLRVERRELFAGIAAQRFFDLSWVSIGLGVLAEVEYHRQTFSAATSPRARSAVGLGLGVFAAAEREISGPLALRLEAGPTTHVLPKAETFEGAITREAIEPSLSIGAALGVIWRL